MEKQSLHFTSLHVRKMPGLPDGLKPITDLSKHINIIAGPNASGKTSTATALHQLLWPPASGSMNLEAAVETGNIHWQLRLDYGQFSAQRDGVTGELHGIPAKDESARYNFALQDLVHIDDKALAGKLYEEAMGGYNLGEASRALKYSPDTKKKNIGPYSNYTTLEAQVAAINMEQQGLKEKENSLSSWIKAREKAIQAGKLKDFYQTVSNCIAARELKESLEFKLAAFPKQLATLFGNEYEELTTLEDKIEALNKELEKNQETINKNQATISELNLPANGISGLVLKELSDRIDLLITAERTIAESALSLAGLGKRLEAVKLQIHPGYDTGEEFKVGLEQITKLDEFIAEAHRLLSQVRFLQAQLETLTKRAPVKNENTDQIKDGIKVLTNWFSEQRASGGTRMFWLWLLIAGAGCLALAVALLGWPAIVGLLLLIIIAVLAQRSAKGESADIRREDYKKTGLKEPAAWNPEAVRSLFEELSLQLQEAERHGLEKQEISRLTDELVLLEPALNKLENQRDEWILLLGYAPALPVGDLKNYSAFFWYISQLSDYASLFSELAGQKAIREEAETQQLVLLKKINELFKESDITAEDGPAAKSALQDLSDRENIRKNTLATIHGLEELANDKERQIKDAATKFDGIFEKLDLETKDVHEVYQLVEQLDDYKELAGNCREKTTLYAEAERLQRHHGSYPSEEEQLAKLDLATAQRIQQEYAVEAAEYEKLNDNIIRTKALVEQESSGHDLEDALARKDAALEGLQQVYEDNLTALTGSLLISHLEKEGGERNSSNVLKRGNQLFNKITNGRYELKINDLAQLDFLAYDHQLHEGQNLDQLSSGTRIQLLLCIRLAYIESQEKEYQIPIIADELLANTDDERAGQIIEALAEVALEGRQIFYFTAQKEEIAKWKSYADAHEGFEVNVYQLEGKINEQSDYTRIDGQPFSLNLFEKVPGIAGQTHESYSKLIAVPGFQFMTQNPAQIHLWYLMDDLPTLAGCLESRITTYGQLINYLKNEGMLAGIDHDLLEEMGRKIDLLAAYQEFYRQGRPKAIDLNVLKSSNAVTGHHLNSVYQVLQDVAYNPVELLHQLNNKAVLNFRSNSKDKLEAYLQEEGYISQEPLLPEDEIKQLVQIKVKKLGMDPGEAKHFLEMVNNA
jgi:uncharacterized protein YhaN